MRERSHLNRIFYTKYRKRKREKQSFVRIFFIKMKNKNNTNIPKDIRVV